MSRDIRAALVAAGAGAIVCGFALVAHTHAFLLGYLVAAVTVSAIPAGALGVLLMTYLIRGAWTDDLHAPLVSAALAAPLAGLLFLPVLVGLPWVYPWGTGAADLGSFKSAYLSPTFFAVRTVVYFALWTALADWARRVWGDSERMKTCAAAGLIVYALTGSLAGIDWLESLTPEFHSSIYGLLFLTFQVLAGLAFALAVALWRPNAPTHRYGAILLAALLLWAYNHAMQYIIIWSGNIPEETIWYVRRSTGAWAIALWSLVFLQFIGPFFALLLQHGRQGRELLLALAVMTVALRLLEAAVLAVPGSDADLAVVAIALIGGGLAAGGLWWIGFAHVLHRIDGEAHDTKHLVGGSASPGPGSHAHVR